MGRHEVQGRPVPTVDVSKTGVADAYGPFQDGRERGLKVTRRA